MSIAPNSYEALLFKVKTYAWVTNPNYYVTVQKRNDLVQTIENLGNQIEAFQKTGVTSLLEKSAFQTFPKIARALVASHPNQAKSLGKWTLQFPEPKPPILSEGQRDALLQNEIGLQPPTLKRSVNRL